MSKPEDKFKYLPGYATEKQVKDRAKQLAIEQGLPPGQYYFGWIKKPFVLEWAMVIVPPKDISVLNLEEQAQVVSRVIMENEGWFPDLPM